MAVIEKAESTRITQLAKLYDGMDARAVAQLMANLDDLTIVSILPRMKQQNAARVLQMIPAKRAARLSKKMMTIAEN
jgi:flagellar motility protein MotE (MotC chaperone)